MRDAHIQAQRCATSRLLCLQALAGLAQWIDIFLIFSVPAFLWRSSPSEIAFLAACFGVPSLVLGPFIGAFLDHSDPRKAMALGIHARSILSALIAFAPGYGAFCALVFLKGLANQCYWPSTFILTNHVVGEDERTRYFSSLSVCDQVSKIATPLVAGVLGLIAGSQLTFLASAALTFVGSSLLPGLFSNLDIERRPRRIVREIRSELLSGFRAMAALDRRLIATIALAVGMSLTLALYDPHVASFLKHSGFDAQAFSLVVAGTAGGAVMGALLVRLGLTRWTPAQLIRSGIVVFAISTTGIAVAAISSKGQGVSVYVALWAVNGMGYELFLIGLGVSMQNLCPRDLLGRVSSSTRSLQMLAVVAGPSIGAWLTTSQTRASSFVAAAGLSVMLLFASAIGLRQAGRGQQGAT